MLPGGARLGDGFGEVRLVQLGYSGTYHFFLLIATELAIYPPLHYEPRVSRLRLMSMLRELCFSSSHSQHLLRAARPFVAHQPPKEYQYKYGKANHITHMHSTTRLQHGTDSH